MTTVHLTPGMVPVAVLGTYTGRRLSARLVATVTVPATAGHWDGGTRDVYRAVRLTDGVELSLTDENRPKDTVFTLQAGIVVVRETQGAFSDLTIYVRPEDAISVLPRAPSTLPPFGHMVLVMSRDRKSQYNGKDRYMMAEADVRHGGDHYRNALGLLPGQDFPSRVDWDLAKAALRDRGLLSKNGAITTAGRNVIAGERGV